MRIPAFGGGLGIEDIIGPKREELLRIALRCGATEVRVFGSVARHAAKPTSDLDLLVRQISDKAFESVNLALKLNRLLGRRVDIVAEGSLHWLLEPQVIAEAVPL